MEEPRSESEAGLASRLYKLSLWLMPLSIITMMYGGFGAMRDDPLHPRYWASTLVFVAGFATVAIVFFICVYILSRWGVPSMSTLLRRYLLAALLFLVFEVGMLAISWIGMRSFLSDIQNHARLGPDDTASIIGATGGLITAIATLVGTVLLGLSRLTRDRGRADRDRYEGIAAVVRAKAGEPRAEQEPQIGEANGENHVATSKSRMLLGRRRSL